MGADFTLAICERSVPLTTAKERLMTLDNTKLGVLWHGYDSDTVDDDEDYVSLLLEDLEICYDLERRDTTTVRLDGKEYVMTGGMSWGDEPTEAFWSVDRVDQLGVTVGDDKWVELKKQWEK